MGKFLYGYHCPEQNSEHILADSIAQGELAIPAYECRCKLIWALVLMVVSAYEGDRKTLTRSM